MPETDRVRGAGRAAEASAAPARSASRKGRGPEYVARRRSELLEAALSTIRRLGPATSMDDIAHEAGITRPILYRFFGDREGLANEVAAVFGGELAKVLQLVPGHGDPDSGPEATLDPLTVARSVIGAFYEVVEREPMLYRFVVHRALYEDPEARGSLQGFVDQIGRSLAVVIGEMLRSSGRDSGPAEPWAMATVGMAVYSAEWWLERRVLTRERMVTYLSDLVTYGIVGPAGPAGQRDAPPAVRNPNPIVQAAQAAAAEVVDAAAGAVSSTIRRSPKGRTSKGRDT